MNKFADTHNKSFHYVFKDMISKFCKENKALDKGESKNVYHQGSRAQAEFLCTAFENILLPGSAIRGVENLIELYKRSQAGESCLILLEHYSNFDFPAFYWLVSLEPRLGPAVAEAILPIQALKLTEGNKSTPILSSCFSTITIYPSRAIDSAKSPEEQMVIRKTSNPMNHSAMGEMTRRKYRGQMILVFPSGTRYKPWQPESKTAVREIDSYLRAFQNVIFVAINGNSLLPDRGGNMEEDLVVNDLLLYSISEIVNGKDFRAEQLKEESKNKNIVADAVMRKLEGIHNSTEPLYKELKKELIESGQWEHLQEK